jgi:hypothetical protein
MSGGDDWYLAREPDGAPSAVAVAVPLPDGEPQRIPAELGEGDNWAWSDDGRLAILRLVRDGQDHRFLESRPVLQSHPSITLTLTGGTSEPDLYVNSWSPDGKRLAALQGIHILANSTWRYPDLVIVDTVDGSERNTGLRRQAIGAILDSAVSWLDWHPHDSRLLAAAVTSIDGHQDGPNRVAVIDTTSGQVQFRTDDSMLATGPAWSPDGTQIAFAGVSPSPELPGLYPWDTAISPLARKTSGPFGEALRFTSLTRIRVTCARSPGPMAHTTPGRSGPVMATNCSTCADSTARSMTLTRDTR